jgi:radical SAM superfamily enzyme YgiQ (UPF0313 family)
MNNMNAPTTAPAERILLALMPFWTPLIPPMGIACLKGYLSERGYTVKTVDANVELFPRECYETYFTTLKDLVPVDKHGNFYNTGRELLRNHMMAHMNHRDEAGYIDLVKEMIHKNYYARVEKEGIRELNRVLGDFYTWLESYVTGLLERERPTVLGLSVYNGTLPASMFVFRLAKEKHPGIRTVMGGGVFADQLCPGSLALDYFMSTTGDYIDTLIAGEGEILFQRWLEGGFPRSRRLITRQDIDGRVLDVSAAGPPQLEDFQLEKYPYSVSYTARSCPFQCSFCSETVQWGKYRKKSPERIAAELKHLYQANGYQLFLFCDSLINPVVTALSRRLMEEPVSLYWESCIRAEKEVCDTNNTLLWRRGGFYKARIGVESGSQHVLDLMNKKTSIQLIKDSVRGLAYAGIKTLTFWIIGHPGETEEDFQQTLDLLDELKDDIYEAEGTPFYYFPTGQSGSGDWLEQYRPRLLYPESVSEILVTPTWILDAPPSREVIYERVDRFIRRLDKLGIPHPYSMREINEADERWKRLQPNAAPALMEFADRERYIDENKQVKALPIMRKVIEDDGEFGF